MSYILDALRKSDQLRRRSGAPTLLLGQAEEAAPKQPALIYYGVFALVLLGAGIAIGWLRPWQPQPTAIPAVPAPAAQSPAVPAPTPAAAPAPVAAAAPIAAAVPAIAAAPVPAAVPATAIAHTPAAATAPVMAATPVPKAEQAHSAGGSKINKSSAPPKAGAAVANKAEPPAQKPAGSSDTGATAALPPPAVMTMAELPLAIQQELPPLSISVHAYSGKAGDRLVGINSRLLHEGEYAAPGLKLEQITPEGMILSYKGYTFRRGVH